MKIIISGTTGVGKSTTVSLLKEYFESKNKEVLVLGELVVESPFFSYYFSDLPNWGFIAQLDFLLQRFKQFVEIDEIYDENRHIVLYDRHFLEDKIFSELDAIKNSQATYISDVYTQIYDDILDKMKFFKTPDYFFLLKANFEIVENRMKNRNRLEEFKFDTKYWKDLYFRYYENKTHRDRFKKYSKKFIEINTDVMNPDDVCKEIVSVVNI